MNYEAVLFYKQQRANQEAASLTPADSGKVEGDLAAQKEAVGGLWGTMYCQTSDISRTKSQNLNIPRLIFQLSLPNPLKPCVKLRMKMLLEQRRQAMLRLHRSDQQIRCLPRRVLYSRFDSMWLWQQTCCSTLIQIVACHLLGAKPLPEPTLTYCQEHISMKLYLKFKSFYLRKCVWKCCLQNVSHFIQTLMC